MEAIGSILGRPVRDRVARMLEASKPTRAALGLFVFNSAGSCPWVCRILQNEPIRARFLATLGLTGDTPIDKKCPTP